MNWPVRCYRKQKGFWDRKYLRVFGLDILLRKKFLAEEVDRRISNALCWTCDVTKVPAVTGVRRRFQEVELLLLRAFDAICRRNGIPYYLSYGTLLGAYRHGGFIPWDDDVDVSVPMSCRDAVQRALEKAIEGTDFMLWGADRSRWDATLRIGHRKFGFLNLDIFYPYAFTEAAGTREDIQKGWQSAREFYVREYKKMKRHEDREALLRFRRSVDAFYATRVPGMVDLLDPTAKQFTIGLFWPHFRLFPIESLLPLKTIRFEGFEFPAPRDPLLYLQQSYDVFSFPPRFDQHGTVFTNFGEEDLAAAEKAARELYDKVAKE